MSSAAATVNYGRRDAVFGVISVCLSVALHSMTKNHITRLSAVAELADSTDLEILIG